MNPVIGTILEYNVGMILRRSIAIDPNPKRLQHRQRSGRVVPNDPRQPWAISLVPQHPREQPLRSRLGSGAGIGSSLHAQVVLIAKEQPVFRIRKCWENGAACVQVGTPEDQSIFLEIAKFGTKNLVCRQAQMPQPPLIAAVSILVIKRRQSRQIQRKS